MKNYSYHTFLFPFTWYSEKVKTPEDFFGYCSCDMRPDVISPLNGNGEMFNQFQYFNAAAKKVMFDTTDDGEVLTVHNYRYNAPHCSMHYVIEKCIDGVEYKYDLLINSVRLRIYDTGIAMLVFELENPTYSKIEDINRINEYGRRLFVRHTGVCYESADSITITGIPGHGDVHSQIYSKDDNMPDAVKNCMVNLPEMILFFLRKDEKEGVTTLSDDKGIADGKRCLIEPIVDGRMFVCCIHTIDDGIMRRINAWNDERCEYAYLADAYDKDTKSPDNTSALIYRFTFIDGGSLTCRSRERLHNMLKERAYDRWIDAGTLITASEFSLMSLTTVHDDDNDLGYTIDAFLTEYVEMATLVLAQRASLLAFSKRIAENAAGSGKATPEIQEDYINFKSRMLLSEVSAQPQGIELYELLEKCLFIKRENDTVEKQITALSEMYENRSAKSQDLLLLFIALLGVFEAVDTLFGFFGMKAEGIIRIIIAFSLIVSSFLIWSKKK